MCIEDIYKSIIPRRNEHSRYSSIIFAAYPIQGRGGSWGLSQQLAGIKQSTPWTGRQSVADIPEINN